jgi:hypothetical protein
MLLMPALQLCNPLLLLIQMKPNNLPPNPNHLFFHILPIPFSAGFHASRRTNPNDGTISVRHASSFASFQK